MKGRIIYSVLAAGLAANIALWATLPVPVERAYIITDEGGGMVGDFIHLYRRLVDAGIPIRIEGRCISACTLILGYKYGSACILPGARLGFHQASNADGKPNEEATEQIGLMFYPQAVQDWIKRHGPLTPKVIYMTGAEAIKLHVLPACKPRGGRYG